MGQSVSKAQLILEINGKARIPCDLKRHLSPRTVGIMLRSLPLEGNVHLMGENIVYIESPVDSGIERPRTDFKAGDIAFLPSSGSVCFFKGDVSSAKRMTPIGRLGGPLDALLDARPGDILRIRAG